MPRDKVKELVEDNQPSTDVKIRELCKKIHATVRNKVNLNQTPSRKKSRKQRRQVRTISTRETSECSLSGKVPLARSLNSRPRNCPRNCPRKMKIAWKMEQTRRKTSDQT